MYSKTFNSSRLVKNEDLNHHNTFFAGRCAEWFVEAGFISAASVLPAENIVCINIHGMKFTKPVFSGQVIDFQSKIVQTGTTSLTAYVSFNSNESEDKILTGFITFVYVDNNGKPQPHGIIHEPQDPEEVRLNHHAKELLGARFNYQVQQ